MTLRPAPTTCPVCGDRLHTTRVSCDGCDTELTGHFSGCEFCTLQAEDRNILRVFLASRGNVKEVERALNVSYPTARARVDAVLTKLGLDPTSDPGADHLPTAQPSPPRPPVERRDRLAMLQQLASGEISVDEALEQI
jgi:hypothetical protein